MGECRSKSDKLNQKDELGVIDMSQVATDLKTVRVAPENRLVSHPPKDARDLRKMIGTRTASGRSLTDIYKQGK